MAGGHGRRIGKVVPPRIPKAERAAATGDLHERERQRREKLLQQLELIRRATRTPTARPHTSPWPRSRLSFGLCMRCRHESLF